ncbi:Tetracycline efflux transporter [Candidatus Nitrospira nitrosa]|uniref:Tetracycline efflux transporter n=1 Tax=Candidatus Nitrospira nitrosa TaxID=1742972 RepID=A0A0S4L1L3_9BACT|nr:TCR/Tet family MFS transporter [Candidatus Nitrospira nitrosa]CUS31431.1 Tetracycline efflux transporter [Candidatus Nitrospira nitrosa]
MSHSSATSAPRQAAVLFILITVLLDMLSFGIIIPVLPKLVEEFFFGDTAQAAVLYGLMGTAWAFMQFFCSPIQGALSDRFGRRPVVLLSNLGLGLDYIVMALAPNVGWLVVGRVISGMASSSFSTAGAYIADVTPPEQRAAAFGKIGMVFGLGFIIGPALGGWLGALDPRLPFWGAAALSLMNAGYGYLVLPESLAPHKRMSFSWARANPVGSLVLLRSHHELFGLATVAFFSYLAHAILPSVSVLYMGYRYGWGPASVGLMMAGVGVAAMIVQGGLIRPITARVGERKTLMLGLSCGAIGFSVYGLAPEGWIFCLGIPVMAFWGLAGPSNQSLMTRHISSSEQGQLQGAIASINGMTGMIGPTLFTQTFAFFIRSDSGLGPQHSTFTTSLDLPGAPFILASLMLLSAAVIAWRTTRRS